MPGNGPARSDPSIHQMLEKLAAREGTGTKGSEMIGRKLTVDQSESLLAQVLYEGHESDFRSVCDPKEHGFTEKATSQTDAVKSPDQYTIQPGFHRMGITDFMQSAVTLSHLIGYPGATILLTQGRTAVNHLSK